MFIINNRDVIIKSLCAANTHNNGQEFVSTWDFASLCTKIPHN